MAEKKQALPGRRRKHPLPTFDEVNRLFRYDPDTGEFFSRGNGKGKGLWKAAGEPIGFVVDTGYLCISIRNRHHLAHRLAWLLMTGYWPKVLIDHRNLNSRDNRFSNLRPATHTQNHANQKKPRNNTSGYKGVVLDRERQKRGHKKFWIAQIKVNQQRIHLGRFATAAEAHEAYKAAANRYFGDFAHGG